METTTEKPDNKADEKLLAEVKKRFQRCEDFELDARALWKADVRFANGDPDNGWQWDDMTRKARELCDAAVDALRNFDANAEALRQIALYIVERKS